MNKAIFFDRDGIVNERIVGDYVKDITQFKFIHDFIELFKKIKKAGYIAILITNQQGIGKGLMNVQQLDNIHTFMQIELLNKTGFQFDDIFYCPDLEESRSIRRKPNPGMLLEAQKKWNIDLKNSWMIGDSENDILAGKNAGTNTVLINQNITNTIADYKFDSIKECLALFEKSIFN
jgi:D-glycero-D-manno-heptose 1,7-bisphosphate phosphatase